MAFTYRLSRRLAQAQVVVAGLFALSCADSQAPTADNTYSDIIREVAPRALSQADSAVSSHDSAATAPLDSAVLITPGGPASVTVANTNEPTGYTTISDRPLNALVESGWTDRGNAAFTIVPQLTAPKSPSLVGQAFFRKGFKGGSGPIQTDLNLRNKKKKEIYLSFWLKLSANFSGSTKSGVNKVYHIWADGISTVVFAAFGKGSNDLVAQLRLQNTEADPRGGSFNLNPNVVTTKKFKRDQWYHVELQLVANTPGTANGKALWWIDGTLVGSYSNVGYLGTQDSPYWEQVSWAPTWGSSGETVPVPMYMYMDHIYVSGR